VIRIIVTGGTFDKTYDEISGRLSFGATHLPEMLRLGRSRVEATIETLMMIDSLDMTDADRARIVSSCLRCPESRIVITHGTDTMVETARAVARGVAGKTVVLTGSMVPYAFGSSDGFFNLGRRAVIRGGAADRRVHCDERAAFFVGSGQKEPRDGRVRATIGPRSLVLGAWSVLRPWSVVR
jgi:L-asparaginase